MPTEHPNVVLSRQHFDLMADQYDELFITHMHAYDHAFCAKLCVAAGGPLVFLPDDGGEIYVVLNERNGMRVPDNILDRIGVPGILVRGKVLNAEGLRALAVEGLAQ